MEVKKKGGAGGARGIQSERGSERGRLMSSLPGGQSGGGRAERRLSSEGCV